MHAIRLIIRHQSLIEIPVSLFLFVVVDWHKSLSTVPVIQAETLLKDSLKSPRWDSPVSNHRLTDLKADNPLRHRAVIYLGSSSMHADVIFLQGC